VTFKKTADTFEAGAHTLSREYYTDIDILEKEYQQIFLKNWICVGRSTDISENGHFVTLNIANENVIILKDDLGKLQAFYNICRHRGTRICEETEGKFSKSIQCNYHGWTYDLQGHLIGAPHMDVVKNFKKDNLPLHPVAIDEWNGFIFLNLSEQPKPIDQTLAPLTKRFSHLQINHLLVKEQITYDVNCNWKLVFQNYCECYHCPLLHPELSKIYHYMGGQNDLYSGPFLGGYNQLNEDFESVSHSGKFSCPPLDGIKDDDLNRVYFYSVFPNMLISLHPEYVMYHTVWPVGIDKCRIFCSWLFTEDVIKSKKHNTKDAIDFWDLTNKQDWHISELSQLGVKSRKYFPSPYSGQESLLAAFDEYYLGELNASA